MKDQIEKKAIEEMAKIISQHTIKNCEEVPFDNIKQMNDGFCVAYVPSCGSCKAARALTKAGYRKQSELTPCDVCKFNPPSSGDGKPCAMCPAQSKGAEDEG